MPESEGSSVAASGNAEPGRITGNLRLLRIGRASWTRPKSGHYILAVVVQPHVGSVIGEQHQRLSVGAERVDGSAAEHDNVRSPDRYMADVRSCKSIHRFIGN